MSNKLLQSVLKRLFDILLSAMLLSAGLPIIICVALLVRWRMGKPVIFRQVRPGLHKRLFVLYKFRTMKELRRPDGTLRSSSERITPLGKLLRRASLDELPQLWNVLRGDMSFVGPRPLLMEYLPLYNAEQARRLDVKPGITGLAQINGRNSISWEKKFAYDVWYVDHWNLTMDIRIMIATVLRVIRSENIDAGVGVGMAAFTGTKSTDNSCDDIDILQEYKAA